MSDLRDDGMDEFLEERANRLELSFFKASLVFLPTARRKGCSKESTIHRHV